MSGRRGRRALVIAICISSDAAAQFFEPLDPSAPQGPYSDPKGPPSEPRPLDQGPGWTYPHEHDEDESQLKPVRAQIERREVPGERFGDAGEFVVTTGFGIGVSSSRWDNSEALTRVGTFSPSLEYFFLRDVSLGVEVDLTAIDSQGYGADGSLIGGKYLAIGGGPHLGVNLRISRWFSIYPRLMVGVHRIERREEMIAARSPTVGGAVGPVTVVRTGGWISLGVPLLFHPAPHYFLGFGPQVYRDFSPTAAGPDIGAVGTSFGVSLLAGGYFGGAERSDVEKNAKDEAPKRRFGDKGTVGLIGETASLQWTRYSGTDSTLSSVSLSPGIDWFVADHLSLGAALTYSSFDRVGFDASSNRVNNSVRSLGALLRLGFDIRLLSQLSLYPQLAFGAGNRHQALSSGIARNEVSANIAWVGISFPVLFHAADHFFIGLGPSFSHDLQRTYEGSSYQNRNTTIGASALVGGWL